MLLCPDKADLRTRTGVPLNWELKPVEFVEGRADRGSTTIDFKLRLWSGVTLVPSPAVEVDRRTSKVVNRFPGAYPLCSK